MPLDPNIAMSFQQPQMPSYNAMVQQTGQNMANMMTMQNSIEDRKQGKADQEAANLAQALLPSTMSILQDPSDAGLDAAAPLVPPEYADAAAPLFAQLKAIKDPKVRKTIIMSSLAKDKVGQTMLEMLQPSANAQLGADTASARLGFDQSKLDFEQQKFATEQAGGKIVKWVENDAGDVVGLDEQGNIVATQPGLGKKTAAAGPDGVKLKPGERMTKDGNVEAVPGSETFNKQKAKHATDYKATRAALDSLKTTAQAVKDLKDTSTFQKATNTGMLMGRMPNMPGVASLTGGYDFTTKYNNLDGAVKAFGRSVASMQGKLGNMAVQEWKMVADSIASLDLTNMDSTTLNNQLDRIAIQLEAAKTTLTDAYEQEYGGSQFYTPLPGSDSGAPDTGGAPQDTNGDGTIDFNDLH